MVVLRHTLNFGASLVVQTVKNLPALLEVHVQSMGQEDTVEKRGATHCSILDWGIPWTCSPWGCKESAGLSDLDFHFQIYFHFNIKYFKLKLFLLF